MRFIETNLPGAFLIEPEPAHDSRGLFVRTFCAREFGAHGLESSFVQHSRSFSAKKGTLRGMHFQRDPYAEAKVVTCVTGAIHDVIIDLRPGSGTYRRWQSFALTQASRNSLYVPAGFAHGFQTLTDGAEVNYLISAYYQPDASVGVRYDDPAFDIAWPLEVSVISERDLGWPPLARG